jgi:hypothetical protein
VRVRVLRAHGQDALREEEAVRGGEACGRRWGGAAGGLAEGVCGGGKRGVALDEVREELLNDRLQVRVVDLGDGTGSARSVWERTGPTIADTRSRARNRMLMSSWLTHASIVSWYPATRCGCDGTILTSASSAIYFTSREFIRQRHIHGAQLTIVVRVLQEGGEFLDARRREAVARGALEHAADDARVHALVQQRDRRGRRDQLRDGRRELLDKPGLVWAERAELETSVSLLAAELAPTSLMILMSIQLFEDVVKSWNSGGANGR